jgi:hypothetical protein
MNVLRPNISSDERQLEELIIDDMVAQKMENPPLVVWKGLRPFIVRSR